MEMPTPKDIAYQRQHIHDSGQHAAVTSNVAGITLASIAIILRIIARRMTRTSLQKDDWMIFAALVQHTLLNHLTSSKQPWIRLREVGG